MINIGRYNIKHETDTHFILEVGAHTYGDAIEMYIPKSETKFITENDDTHYCLVSEVFIEEFCKKLLDERDPCDTFSIGS